jgi:hypothetical protein
MDSWETRSPRSVPEASSGLARTPAASTYSAISPATNLNRAPPMSASLDGADVMWRNRGARYASYATHPRCAHPPAWTRTGSSLVEGGISWTGVSPAAMASRRRSDRPRRGTSIRAVEPANVAPQRHVHGHNLIKRYTRAIYWHRRAGPGTLVAVRLARTPSAESSLGTEGNPAAWGPRSVWTANRRRCRVVEVLPGGRPEITCPARARKNPCHPTPSGPPSTAASPAAVGATTIEMEPRRPWEQ